MTPKLQTRRIGGVNIFELRGVYVDPSVSAIRQSMQRKMREEPGTGLLMNLKELERLDDSGAATILETARRSPKAGILGHNLSTYFVAEHMDPSEPIPIFEGETEAVGYFKKEFAEENPEAPARRRRFPRIRVALPLEFEFKDFGETLRFEGVVTNLSEGGLFCYFLDTRNEELASRMLDPFDLKLMDVRLTLSEKESVRGQGKVIRTVEEDVDCQGLAMEFYNLAGGDKEKIKNFLKQQGEEPKKGARK